MPAKVKPIYSSDIARKYPDKITAILTAIDKLPLSEAVLLLVFARSRVEKAREAALLDLRFNAVVL